MPPQAQILSNLVLAGNWDKRMAGLLEWPSGAGSSCRLCRSRPCRSRRNRNARIRLPTSQFDSRIMAGRSGRDCSSLLADRHPDPECQNKTTFTIRTMSQPWDPAEKVRGRFSGRPGNVDLPRPWPVDDGGGRKGTHSVLLIYRWFDWQSKNWTRPGDHRDTWCDPQHAIKVNVAVFLQYNTNFPGQITSVGFCVAEGF